MISHEEIRAIADGKGSVYHFDLSKISGDYYEPLLKTLQHFAKKNIESLGFNCDELFHAEQKLLIGKPMPVNVLNSIAKTKSHYIRNVVELVCHVIPRSTTLLEITLSNLNIKKDYISRIISAFSHSPSLETINLVKIPLGDESFRVLLKYIDPNQIKNITIMYCGITEVSLKDILDFIYRKDENVTKNGGIENFVISRAEISQNGQNKIQEALKNKSVFRNEINPKFLGNQNIENPIKNKVEHLPILKNTNDAPNLNKNKNSPKKISMPKANSKRTPSKEVVTISNNSAGKSDEILNRKMKEMEFQRYSEMMLLKELEYQNIKLTETLNQLKQSMKAVQYDDETFIIGAEAEKFVSFVKELESKVSLLEEKKTEYSKI
ncbi:hypothetical protein TRFO_25599 [Tritrichomonas foetus]|uniref:Uncharacterized protein n=1 Tax=Tritrichomonas foetus TaxID=1144522 RepID=A0A1J4K5R1_9EUKA|nr:hypothetical protein TRFO_25599 [Tritrichomonas foetus]|eukprot:OHT06330.1 hypothetical protein TRFO_25599 [Tritrichomonas foetus]